MTKYCPSCGSGKVYRSGFRYVQDREPIQRFSCGNCGRRFSQTKANTLIKVNIKDQIFEGSNSTENHANRGVANSDSSGEKVLNSFSFNGSEDIGAHNVTIIEKGLNPLRICNREYRVGATLRSAKNLETEIEKQTLSCSSTQTDKTNMTVKGLLVAYLFKMDKQGYALET